MDKEIRKKNDLTLKLRCKNLLEIKEKGKTPEWTKVYDKLYKTYYHVEIEDEKSYPVIADLFKFSNHKNVQYCLIFSDMPQELHNQNYKPLRELGKLVFAREKYMNKISQSSS